MKINKYLVAGSVLLAACFGVASCTKEKGQQVAKETLDNSNAALVQVYNATLNASRNYLYVDGVPVTGAALAFAGTFPSTPADFRLTAGLRGFLLKDTLSTTTQPQLSFSNVFQAGGNYTIFTYDTLTAVKQKTVTNDILIPDDTTARVRFANFIYSNVAVPNVDIYSIKRAANAFVNVPVTGVTNYISYASALTDTLLVRETGTTNLLYQLNGFNPTRKRSYTLIFRGRYGTTSGTVARTLSAFSNN